MGIIQKSSCCCSGFVKMGEAITNTSLNLRKDNQLNDLNNDLNDFVIKKVNQ